ncbi:MAG TPA: hypothetical protein DCZ49_08440 [Hyphomonadaceae bacterium]|nr:hypothetical protein [Hyphomonadaceae bacterium]
MHTQISCALGTMPSKIFDLVQSRSGFSPVEPVRRVPFLKAAEREEISLGVMADLSSSMRQSALKRLRQAVRAWAALGRIRSQRVLATGLTGRNFWVK